MSWDRRQFLTALAGLVAAAGADPTSLVEGLKAAPMEELQRVLAHYTIRIGQHTYPLQSVTAMRLAYDLVDVTEPWHRSEHYATGVQRMDPLSAVLAEGADVGTLAGLVGLTEPQEVELRLGEGGPSWRFKGYVRSAAWAEEGPASVEVVGVGLVELR